MKMLKTIGRFLIGAYFLTCLVTFILSVCVWLFSPYIGTDAFPIRIEVLGDDFRIRYFHGITRGDFNSDLLLGRDRAAIDSRFRNKAQQADAPG